MPQSRGRTRIVRHTAHAAAIAICLTMLAAPHLSLAAEVTATQLDGKTVTGTLKTWDATQAIINAYSGDQRIPTDQLMSLHWSAIKSPLSADPNTGQVAELIDGSQIPITSVRVQQSKVADVNGSSGKLEVAMLQPSVGNSQDAKGGGISIQTQYIAALRLKPLAETLAKQWSEIRSLKLPDDVLVVIKRDGTSLDYVEGVLGDITDDRIEFKIDGESNRVDRSKVAGVIYSRPKQKAQQSAKFTLRASSGLTVGVTNIIMNNSFVIITTPSGASFRWPLDDLEAADYSSDKALYLSDIEPASQSWSPLVGLPPGVTLAAEYGQPRRNRSAFASVLTLVMKGKEDLPGQPGVLRSFDKGLALRSRSELVYRIPEGFNHFTALAGIDPATASTGNVQLQILADDHSLLETEIAGNEPPQPIDIRISEAKRLKIIVDFGQNLDTGDWLNLCDAKIMK